MPNIAIMPILCCVIAMLCFYQVFRYRQYNECGDLEPERIRGNTYFLIGFGFFWLCAAGYFAFFG